MADITVSCVNLTTATSLAADDIMRLFRKRTQEKDRHHARGCLDSFRTFLAMVFTTENSACPQFWRWWDRVWAFATTRHEAIGGDPRDVERAKQQTMAAIHAINVRLTANAIHTLHHDQPPLSSPAGAAQQDQDTAPPTPLTPASGSRGEAGPSGTHSGDFHTPDGAR